MRLESITTDPQRYQRREAEYSEQTVECIVREGIDLAKFDPIPVIKGGATYVVAGDGHSRFEACKRLAAESRLPKQWKRGKSWDIPTRIVKRGDAVRLARTANMSKDPFKPMEEANIFKERLDAGETMEQIAESSHRTVNHVRSMLMLHDVCTDIQHAIDAPDMGINVMTAQVLAAGFKRWNIAKDQQRELWHRALKHAGLNPSIARRIIDAIGKRMNPGSGKPQTGMMFDLPENVVAIITETKAQFMALREAKRGLDKLLSAQEAGALIEIPDLSEWLARRGKAQRDAIQKRLDDEGCVLGGFVRR